MSAEGVDLKRRRFLTAAASVVGGVGVVAVAVPFVSSMQPSARAQAAGAPVEADISQLAPGVRGVEGPAHAPGLFAALPPRHGASRSGCGLEGRVLLPLPRIQV